MRLKLFCLMFLQVVVITLSAQTKKAKLFILSVGVATYQDNQLNLNYADNDAQDLAAAFQKQTELWDVREVKVLTDANATRSNVRSELERFKTLVTSDDFFVFVFSGHGIKDRLVTYDFNRGDIESSSIGKNDLYNKLNGLGCGYMVFLDACHSGSFAKDVLGKNITEEELQNDSREIVNALASTDKPILVFGSSASDQVSFECDKCKNGYFAQTILDALENKTVTEGSTNYLPDQNNDFGINPYELDAYIKQAVRINTLGLANTQKVYSKLTLGENFKLFRVKGAPKPDPDPVIVQPIKKDDDGDGFANNNDECPNESGTLNGCPDKDADGIKDKDDACPDSPGSKTNKGCPVTDDFVFVKGGTFEMGYGSVAESPEHNVTVSDFYIAKEKVSTIEYNEYLVSQKMGILDGLDEFVLLDWYDALLYCNWLSVKNGLKPVYNINKSKKDPNYKSPQITLYSLPSKPKKQWLVIQDISANGYCLPTEAEWEFAATSGNRMPSTYRQYDPKIIPEWCWDWYSETYYYESKNSINPTGPISGWYKVYRGDCEDRVGLFGCNFSRNSREPCKELRNGAYKGDYTVGLRLVRH